MVKTEQICRSSQLVDAGNSSENEHVKRNLSISSQHSRGHVCKRKCGPAVSRLCTLEFSELTKPLIGTRRSRVGSRIKIGTVASFVTARKSAGSSPNNRTLLRRTLTGTRPTASHARRMTSGLVFSLAQNQVKAGETNARINALGINADKCLKSARGAVVNVATKTMARKFGGGLRNKEIAIGPEKDSAISTTSVTP